MPVEKPESKLLDDQDWLDLLEPMLREDPALAHRAARLWHHLLVELESGPEGVARAMGCLEDALRLTFPFTKTYKACTIPFQATLGDDIPSKNDSLAVLSEAIIRVRATLRRPTRSRRDKQRKRSRQSR